MLEDKIHKDYQQALKARNKHRADFLSFLRAEFKDAAIGLKKKQLDDNEAIAVLKKQKKRLEETKESIATSGRVDLIEANNRELALISEYLPKPLEETELIRVIEQTITECGASSLKDMGRVMKEVLARVGASADAKRVSEVVKEKLSGH